jgi:hypothetical protein
MLLAALTGVVAGLARGGRLRRVGADAFARWPLLAAGVVLQAVARWVPDAAGTVAIVVSFAVLIVFVLSNLRLAGMAVVGIGLAMNTAVIAANGGMPVREEAVVAAGIAEEGDLDGVDLGPKRHVAGDDDRLMLLADIIPVAATGEVLSFGDLVLTLGIADVVYHLLRRRAAPTVPPPVEEVAALGP